MMPENVEGLDCVVNEVDNVLTIGIFQVTISFSTSINLNTIEDLLNY